MFEDEREARALADERSLKARIEEQSRVKHVTLENLFETIADAEVKELNLIIKADVQGSIEALQDSLDKMDQSEVRINTIHSAVGAINETDVVLADASNAIIIGFGVRPDGKARSAAEREGVEIRCYDVIYKCLEELDAARIGMLKPTEVEVSTGTATVLDTFKVPKVGIAAGVRVEEGEIAATDSVRLVRDGIVVFNGKNRLDAPLQGRGQEPQERFRGRHWPGGLPGHQARRPDRGLPHRPGCPYRVGGSAMKQTQATRRLGEQLREKLGYILLFEVSDPRLDLVTLTAVEVAVDRSFARVYVSCDASRYDEVMEALASAKGRIRSLLARSLDWRVTPELDFRIDRSTDEAERITRALENVPATLAIEKDEDGYPIADAAQEAALDD